MVIAIVVVGTYFLLGCNTPKTTGGAAYAALLTR
jgi:predicted small secreted protein